MSDRLVPPYIDSPLPEEDQPTLWAPSCLTCNGAGTTHVPLYRSEDPGERVACPQCNGTGIADFGRSWPA